MPCVREVFPAPRPPESTSRSPAWSSAPSLAPQACVSSTVGSRTGRDRPTRSPSGGIAPSLKRLHPSSLGQVGDRSPDPRFVTLVQVGACGPFRTLDERQQLLANHIAMLQHDDVTGIVDQDVLGTRDQPDDLLAVLGR